MSSPKTVIIGAGIAGLTAAALLLREGHDVTVLEAQVYAGGCAGTFPYQGYRFDAGATLAGGFSAGGPHWQVAQQLGLEWPVKPVDPIAWVVHLPDGQTVRQWVSLDKWREERRRAFPSAEKFWLKQELLADIAWDVSTRPFPWPPEKGADLVTLGKAIRPKTLQSTPYILRSIGSLMPKTDPMLNVFVDANLLISAQVTADRANALYGSAALDLPRRGVNHIIGGIGSIADTLVNYIRQNGGKVLFRQQVDEIEIDNTGKATVVHTNVQQVGKRRRSKQSFPCDYVLANQTPWGVAKLLGAEAPNRLSKEVGKRDNTWGASMLFLGVNAAKLPADIAGHHQVVLDRTKPLGETNSIFLSMSDANDSSRTPEGMLAVNISTHTEISQWWKLRNDPHGQAAYDDKRDGYVERMLNAAEKAIPGFRQAVELVLPATPVTYEHWTGRPMGMVGGFPQTSILQARGPATGVPNVWLVGDSVFPGQSTAGVTLSALRVARGVLHYHQRQQRRLHAPSFLRFA